MNKAWGCTRKGFVGALRWLFVLAVAAPLAAFASLHHPAQLAKLAEHGDHAALARLERSARSGDVKAQVALGDAFSYRRHGRRQYAKAVYWYKKAALQGYATAEFDLGLSYEMGDGVPKSYVKAAYWYKKAAAQGNGAAEEFLGFAYAIGEGVPTNYAKAHYWRKKAAASNWAKKYDQAQKKAAANAQRKAAQATNWFILDETTHRCVNAKAFAAEYGAQFASPLAMRNALRAQSDWKGFKVFRHLRGKLVELETNNGGYMYFSTLALCRAVQEKEPSLNALR